MLVEGAVEWIIEDVLTVVNGDWEMMTAVFVLELDTVRGVVQCVNFHGFYFCPYRTFWKNSHTYPGCYPGLRRCCPIRGVSNQTSSGGLEITKQAKAG